MLKISSFVTYDIYFRELIFHCDAWVKVDVGCIESYDELCSYLGTLLSTYMYYFSGIYIYAYCYDFTVANLQFHSATSKAAILTFLSCVP